MYFTLAFCVIVSLPTFFYLKKHFYTANTWDPLDETKADEKPDKASADDDERKLTQQKKITQTTTIDNAHELSEHKKDICVRKILPIVASYLTGANLEMAKAYFFPPDADVKRIKFIFLGNNRGQIVGFNAFTFRETKEGKTTFAVMNSSAFIDPAYKGRSSTLYNHVKEFFFHVVRNLIRLKLPLYFDVMTPYSYTLATNVAPTLYPKFNRAIPSDIKEGMMSIITELTKAGFKRADKKSFYVLETPLPFQMSKSERDRFVKSDNPNIKFFIKEAGLSEQDELVLYQLAVMVPGDPINLLGILFNMVAKTLKQRVTDLSDYGREKFGFFHTAISGHKTPTNNAIQGKTEVFENNMQ